MGKVNSFGGGGSSYGNYPQYPSYGGGQTQSYPKPKWEDPYEKPDYSKNKGFSSQYKEGPLFDTILGNPHAILPEFMDPGGVAYQWMRGLDTGSLTELTGRMSEGGTAGWHGRQKIDKKTGYIQQPMYKQGKYANELGSFYAQQKLGGESMLDRGQLMHALVTAKNNSYVGYNFSPKRKTIDSVASRYNPRTGDSKFKKGHVTRGVKIPDQLQSADRYLSAITSVGPEYTAAAYQQAVQNDIDTWTNEALKRKRAGSLTHALGRAGW
jgi:hypothetical protein